MSRTTKKRTESPYVPVAVCDEKHAALSKEILSLGSDIQVLKKALVGEDLQSGLVKEVSEIKSRLRTQSGLWDFVKPIIVAIISAVITACILGAAWL